MTKHYKLHELTTEVLVEMFGDSSDWYSVLKNGKRVGSFSDLRKAIIKRQEKEASKLKQKREQSELNKSNTVRSTSDAKRFFESELKNAEVFINRTQPNIHVNNCKCYIVCGPTDKVRLGIKHHTKTFDDMLQEASIPGLPNADPNHILFDNLSLDDAKDLIKLLCI